MPVSRLHLRGHPIHPMLVVFPVAFLSSALPADVMFLIHGAEFWAWLALLLNAAGSFSGLLAAAIGMVDFFGVKGVRDRVSAWSHALSGLALLALAVANTALRWPDPKGEVLPVGLVLSGAMFALVMVTGWLGGTLSFKYGIGVYGRLGASQPRKPR